MYASYSPAPRTNTWQPAGGEGYWPTDLLEAFTLQMASHGHSVSSSMMMGDRRYALEQLVHAHSLADDYLHDLAMSLFRHFEVQQSGVRSFS